jgi:hypothetical protein
MHPARLFRWPAQNRNITRGNVMLPTTSIKCRLTHPVPTWQGGAAFARLHRPKSNSRRVEPRASGIISARIRAARDVTSGGRSCRGSGAVRMVIGCPSRCISAVNEPPAERVRLDRGMGGLCRRFGKAVGAPGTNHEDGKIKSGTGGSADAIGALAFSVSRRTALLAHSGKRSMTSMRPAPSHPPSAQANCPSAGIQPRHRPSRYHPTRWS